MTVHDHQQFVLGCYRCDLSRDECTQPTLNDPCPPEVVERLSAAIDAEVARMQALADGRA